MKRLGALLLIAVMAATLTSCDFAKVNGRCKAGAPLARDNTHVLRCEGGKWKRFITVQQAAQFILGQLPGSIALDGAAPALTANEAFTIAFKATTRAGGPAVGEKVTVTGPAFGPSIKAETTAVTDATGVATFDLTATGALGAFDLTAKVGEVSVKQSLTVKAGAPTQMKLISGNAPVARGAVSVVIVEVLDKNGLAVSGATVLFTATNATAITPAVVTGASGRATGQVTAPTGPSAPIPFGITASVDASSAALSFQVIAV